MLRLLRTAFCLVVLLIRFDGSSASFKSLESEPNCEGEFFKLVKQIIRLPDEVAALKDRLERLEDNCEEPSCPCEPDPEPAAPTPPPSTTPPPTTPPPTTLPPITPPPTTPPPTTTTPVIVDSVAPSTTLPPSVTRPPTTLPLGIVPPTTTPPPTAPPPTTPPPTAPPPTTLPPPSTTHVLHPTTFTMAPEDRECPGDWIKFEASCYKFPNETDTWSRAQEYCEAHGASLPEVTSLKENQFLKKNARTLNFEGMWLGATDLVTEGQFVWVKSKTPIIRDEVFTDWGFETEPNDKFGTEDCLHMYQDYYYMWNDYTCSRHQNFACELEL